MLRCIVGVTCRSLLMTRVCSSMSTRWWWSVNRKLTSVNSSVINVGHFSSSLSLFRDLMLIQVKENKFCFSKQ